MSTFPEVRQHHFEWPDGSVYEFRIAQETYRARYKPAPGGQQDTHIEFNKKLLDAFKAFIETGKMSKDEFKKYINYDGHFDDDDLSFLD